MLRIVEVKGMRKEDRWPCTAYRKHPVENLKHQS